MSGTKNKDRVPVQKKPAGWRKTWKEPKKQRYVPESKPRKKLLYPPIEEEQIVTFADEYLEWVRNPINDAMFPYDYPVRMGISVTHFKYLYDKSDYWKETFDFVREFLNHKIKHMMLKKQICVQSAHRLLNHLDAEYRAANRSSEEKSDGDKILQPILIDYKDAKSEFYKERKAAKVSANT